MNPMASQLCPLASDMAHAVNGAMSSGSGEKLSQSKRRRLRKDAVDRYHAKVAILDLLKPCIPEAITRDQFLRRRLVASDIQVRSLVELSSIGTPVKPFDNPCSQPDYEQDESWQVLPPSMPSQVNAMNAISSYSPGANSEEEDIGAMSSGSGASPKTKKTRTEAAASSALLTSALVQEMVGEGVRAALTGVASVLEKHLMAQNVRIDTVDEKAKAAVDKTDQHSARLAALRMVVAGQEAARVAAEDRLKALEEEFEAFQATAPPGLPTPSRLESS